MRTQALATVNLRCHHVTGSSSYSEAGHASSSRNCGQQPRTAKRTIDSYMQATKVGSNQNVVVPIDVDAITARGKDTGKGKDKGKGTSKYGGKERDTGQGGTCVFSFWAHLGTMSKTATSSLLLKLNRCLKCRQGCTRRILV